MRMIARFIAVICVMLGTLWLLQGLGVVHVRPILCFANCERIQGASAAWATAGFVMLMAGIIAILLSFKGRTPRS